MEYEWKSYIKMNQPYFFIKLKEKIVGYAISDAPNYFSFGAGYDFCIWDECNSKDYSGNNHTYNTSEYYELTGGKNNFYVNECEIYHVEFYNLFIKNLYFSL